MKFCFYGSGIYDALIGNPPGGAELQVALIAKALSENEHQVTIIDNKGSGTETKVGSLTVKFTAKSKVKGIRFITQKIPNSFRFLIKAHADYYYVRGLSYLNVIVAFVVRKLKAKFILGLAHDTETLSLKLRFSYVFSIRTSVFTWLKSDLPSCLAGAILFKRADFVLVQHADQKKALYTRNLKSVVYPNIFLPVKGKQNQDNLEYFVYAGSLNERKGLTELLLILENCKGMKFEIIGQPHGKHSEEKVNLFKNYSNVQYFGPISREVVLCEICSSKGLINFSKMEGFPNTFLEAWSCGVPVFSLWVDPGGVIENFNLGKCFHGDLDSMSNFLKTYIPTGSSEKIKDYVTLNHSYEKAADRFLEAISLNQ